MKGTYAKRRHVKVSRIIRIIVIVLIVVIFGYGIYLGAKPVPNSEKVWDERTTVGSMDAENYFIIYTDLMCPYCIAFENAILENEDEFHQYIDKNNVLLEIKVSDFLFEYGESRPINSRYGAMATYCATDEGKFWDYYKIAVTTLWNDYFKTLGKSAFTALNEKTIDFWIELGYKVGLGEIFKNCVMDGKHIDLLISNTKKTLEAVNGGMPYFKFNKYSFSGFDMSWGWDYVKLYFDKGLATK